MTDRPILFGGPMVRALLDGRKTQTRRVLKPQPNRMNGGKPLNDGRGSYSCEFGWTRLPYTVGDRLWVRETWAPYDDVTMERRLTGEGDLFYRANDETVYDTDLAWRPSIFMPRWASRLTLIVTDVRVEWLKDITIGDICAEGLARGGYDAFANLWDSLNASRGYGWDANPWVCAVTFTAHPQNIDVCP